MQNFAQYISDFYQPGECEWGVIADQVVSELYYSFYAASQVQWISKYYSMSQHCTIIHQNYRKHIQHKDTETLLVLIIDLLSFTF